MSHANCDSCSLDYDFTPKNAVVHLYLEYPRANHVVAFCPNMHQERIFVTNAGFMQIMSQVKLPITFALSPNKRLRSRADAIWGEVTEGETEPEIEVPHYMLRELYDQLREFEAGGDATKGDTDGVG